jgi:hypothetical protein
MPTVAPPSRPKPRTSARGSRRFLPALALALISCAGCCSAETARPPTRVRRPRPAALRELHVEPALAPDGKTRAYLVWPAEAFEENLVEERREREELRAAPFWARD